MLPARRARNSLPSSPTPGDEVTNLTLPEVRDRLARNARVLSSFMFSPSTSPASASVLNAHMAGPSRHPQPPRDPVREKLEATREALLAREAELLAQPMEGITVKDEPDTIMDGGNGSPVDLKGGNMGRRSSAGLVGGTGTGRSGKQRALDTIRQGETELGMNTILLPIEQTLSLGSRDYTTQTLDTFTHLSLNKQKSYSANGTQMAKFDPLDENARAQTLARMNTFMSYKGDGDDDDDDVFGFEGDGEGEGEYEGDDDRMTVNRGARGTGERVDQYGEDEEEWREGADDEYTLGGGDLNDS